MAGRVLIGLGALLVSLGAAGQVVYVNISRAGETQDGRSWQTAFRALQDGINAAGPRGAEVWVAQGLYNETRAAGGSLLLSRDVRVFGGFDGTETAREHRNAAVNPTVIDGGMANAGAPANTVVVGANGALLDGFIIRGGRGQDGAGMVNNETSPRVVNCTFFDNEAGRFGGAVLNLSGASPIFEDCLFNENRAGDSGGAMANLEAAPVLVRCTFSLNEAGVAGGALFNSPSSDTLATACTFTGNAVDGSGGAIFSDQSAISLDSCRFSGNDAGGFGGAAFVLQGDAFLVNNLLTSNRAGSRGGALAGLSTTLTVVNCTIADNTAGEAGGGIFLNDTTGTLLNSIAWGNTPASLSLIGSSFGIRYSNVQGGAAGDGNIAFDPRFIDPAGGDYGVQPQSRCINAGTENGAPPVDIAGVSRPQSGRTDMGAFEARVVGIPEPKLLFCGSGSTGTRPSGDLLVAALLLLALIAAHRRKVVTQGGAR